MSVLNSAVGPTEYDLERDRLGRHVLVDDRHRRFVGLTVRAAFRRAERAQNVSDPIHHPPYPDPVTIARHSR